jgi:hypothetical protein
MIRFTKDRKAKLLVIDKAVMDRCSLNFLDKISSGDLRPINATGTRASGEAIMMFLVIDQMD